MDRPCPSDSNLMLFSTGVLGDEDIAAIGEHLDECGRCRAVLDAAPPPFASNSFPIELEPSGSGLRRAVALVHLIPAPSSDEPQDEPDAPSHFGRFRVVERLGAGAMGVVYEAEDERLGRRVAVKMLRPAFASRPGARDRFLREARATAALHHPNVVSILEVGDADAGPYLVMELLAGESLGMRLRRVGKLAAADAVRIGREVAAGLAAAHRRGLIHRDVTPDNIWLAAEGPAKLLDFGLVRFEGDAATTTPGTIVGTPRYMSPEQARATAFDHRADLFGLGAVLYHAVTGELPFPGADTLAVLSALATHTPAPADKLNPNVPRRLAAAIARMLAKLPADRPPTADAAISELAESLLPPPRRWWRLLVPLLLLAALGGWLATRPEPLPAVVHAPEAVVQDPPLSDDPDRVAAKWVLSQGGYAVITIIHEGRELSLTTSGEKGTIVDRSAAVPAGPIQVTHININRNNAVTDDGLVALRGLKHLTFLQVSNSPRVTDAMLLHFLASEKLEAAKFHSTALTDEGLQRLEGFALLRSVDLNKTRATEDGMRKLSRAMPKCKFSWRNGTIGPFSEGK